MELLNVQSVQSVREKLLECVSAWNLDTEHVPIDKSLGRVLSKDIVSMEDIPGFNRSTVDGYALKSKDTNAAGDSIPVILDMIGSVDMGHSTTVKVDSGQCVEVATGAMLPEGADAVVMVEYTECFTPGAIAVNQSVAVGDNMVHKGEDVRQNATVLRRGVKIAPQEIGTLAAMGISSVPVFRPVKLAIISTGDELVTIDCVPKMGQVRDINTHALAALAAEKGFDIVYTAAIKDDEAILENELRKAMEICDIIAVSGGSSQGKKDATRTVIDKVSDMGAFTHGMAIKPGKPTIVGYDSTSQTILTGLPGHPVSAMIVFEILFCYLLREMWGQPEPIQVPAEISVNLASSPGKSTFWPVKLVSGENGYIAVPVFGKSGLITTLSGADGYTSIPRESEGLPSGSHVYVTLF